MWDRIVPTGPQSELRQLLQLLEELLVGYDLEILEGKGYVEVKVRGVNKGVAVNKALQKVKQMFGEVEFVLCIGDDRSDEEPAEPQWSTSVRPSKTSNKTA
eukprot:g31165.t1